MQPFKKGWYVIYTKPRHEKKTASSLKAIGIEFFLPLVKKMRVWSDRRKYVDEALFPSYVFVRLDDLKSYFTSLDIHGILYYVRAANQIAIIHDEVIDNLKCMIANSNIELEVSSEEIPPGEHVVIKDGLLIGKKCEVVKYSGKEKVLVRIELLHRNILVDVPSQSIMPVCSMSYY